jgi:DNA ligase D-like protein (predicted polymerase)
VKIQEKRKIGDYLIVDDLPGLVGLVQIGILEIHTWNSRVEHLEQPDRLVFDLDPAEDVPWPAVIAAARLLRARLEDTGSRASSRRRAGRASTSSSRSRAGPAGTTASPLSREMAEEKDLVREAPEAFVAVMSKARRTGRIYIDYLRNQRGATSVSAYSTRAKPEAPVSTPLTWDELRPDVASTRYTVANLPRRLASLRADPWAGFAGDAAAASQEGAAREVALRQCLTYGTSLNKRETNVRLFLDPPSHGGPSHTAEFMAPLPCPRVLPGAPPRPVLFDDPFARACSASGVSDASSSWRDSADRRGRVAFHRLPWPGARSSGVARTRLIDDLVTAALEEGVEQIVLLGAGFDSRAYRLPGIDRARVFEVDHPATHAAKKGRLRKFFARLPSHVDLHRGGLRAPRPGPGAAGRRIQPDGSCLLSSGKV